MKFSEFLKEQSKEYDEFFKSKLKKYGVNGPDELSTSEKKKFFNEIDREWKGEKNESVMKEEKKGKKREVTFKVNVYGYNTQYDGPAEDFEEEVSYFSDKDLKDWLMYKRGQKVVGPEDFFSEETLEYFLDEKWVTVR